MEMIGHDVFPAAWSGLLLTAVVVAAGVAFRFGRVGAVVLASLSLLWLLNNQRLEGGTLIYFSGGHGLNNTDLPGLAGLALAGWLWIAHPSKRS